jgi:hypothetical protein
MAKLASDDDDFTRSIAQYLAAGMPAKHGMSEEAYIARCRELWDACETDETCKAKLLIDRLYTETLNFRDRANKGYVDPRVRAADDLDRSIKDVLHCVAIGTVPYSSLVMGDDATDTDVEEVTEPEKTSEFGLWMIAVLDVLGFERTYRRVGPQRMRAAYERLIQAARAVTDPSLEMGMHSVSEGVVPTLFEFDVGFAYFSDTLLLWAPLSEMLVAPFLARCSDVFLEALSLGIPLRGAVAVGEAVLNQKEGVFLGTPLIDAARLEHAQDWLGIALTASCASVLSWVDSSLVLPYTAPYKQGTKHSLHSGLVLDWPRRARKRNMNVLAALDAIEPPDTHGKYYDHARIFVDHSLQHARWNREDHIPITMGFLTRSIIRTRLDGAPSPPEAAAMLESMALNGDDEIRIAAYLRSLLGGAQLPLGIETLPAGPLGHLKHLEQVIEQHYVDLEEVAFAAVEQRYGVVALTPRHERYLTAEPTDRNGEWQRCIPVLRAIAAGADVPEIPSDVLDNAQRILRNARDSAIGSTVRVDIETLLAGVMWASTAGASLSDVNVRRLQAMRSHGAPWDSVADFLAAVSEGTDPDVHLAKFDEGAISTIRVVRQTLGWQEAVRRSITDAYRMLERVDVRLLNQVAVDTVAAIRDSAAGALPDHLARLRRSGSPHDAVARYIERVVADRRAPDMPGGVPSDVDWYLRLIVAFAFPRVRRSFPLNIFSLFPWMRARSSGR